MKLKLRLQTQANSRKEHGKALEKTGFWGRRAAGCIFFSKATKRFMLSHRSEDVLEPGTWGTWGGALDKGEGPIRGCLREIREETNYQGPVKLVLLYEFKHDSGFKYYNYLAIVNDEFEPDYNWESQGHRWFTINKWPRPLHPGVKELVKRKEVLETLYSYVNT
jgi:8-oxo-dGTP pyrophosphatase MutT (NUDIX family)